MPPIGRRAAELLAPRGVPPPAVFYLERTGCGTGRANLAASPDRAGIRDRGHGLPNCDGSEQCEREGWTGSARKPRPARWAAIPASGGEREWQRRRADRGRHPARADARSCSEGPASCWSAGTLAGRAGAQGPRSTPACRRCPGRGRRCWARPPGSGGSSSATCPATAGILGGRPGVVVSQGHPDLDHDARDRPSPTDLQDITAPPPQPVGRDHRPHLRDARDPLGGGDEEDNPPDGLTSTRSSTSRSHRSLDLRSKFYEIPMARADILQAGLRSNPIFYQDGQLLQYKGQPFSRARPGGPQQFDTNVTYPLDISHKRQARIEVATRAERVLEAYYQDAVRQRIDDVYDAYVTALAARQTVRYAKPASRGWRTSRPASGSSSARAGSSRSISSRSRSSSAPRGSRLVDARPTTARPCSTWAR